MAQTPEGALKARDTMIRKYGIDHYKKAGALGGKNGTTGGFHYAKLNYTPDDPRHPAYAGRKGGKSTSNATKGN